MPFSQILENKVLLAGFIASVCLLIPYYYILKLPKFSIIEKKHVITFFVFWSLIYLFEFYFLGPYSFVELSHEGNHNIAINHYLANAYDGGRFSHQFGGGQDIYTLLPGMQYLNPERWLSHLFPTWIVILAQKSLGAALGFSGAYLLARSEAKQNRGLAVAVAALFPVSHEYLLNFSTNWGTGFATLPLAVYAAVASRHDRRHYGWVLLAGLFLAASDPIHVFPPLLLAIIGYAFLIGQADLKRAAVSLLLYGVLSFLSWHEVLFAVYLAAADTTRAVYTSNNFFNELIFAADYLRRNWVPAVFYLASCLVLAARNDPWAKRSITVLAFVTLAFAIAQTLPWDKIGLGFLNKLSHYYMLLSMTVLFIPVTAKALGGLNALNGQGALARLARTSWSIRAPIVVLALALSILTWNKFLNFSLLAWFGGQGAYFAVEPLNNPQLNVDRDYRVITLFETPPPNVVAGFYDFDSFDGAVNIASTAWDTYWTKIMSQAPGHILTTRTGVDWRHWNGETYDVGKHVRLDLLRIANVRYLFSALPLRGDGLRLVSGSRREEWAKVRPEFFDGFKAFLVHRLKRVFNPGRLYVYELDSPLPRVFAATGVQFGEAGYNDLKESEIPLKREIIVDPHFKEQFDGLGELQVTAFQKTKDGFDIEVDAKAGGVLVINNAFSPFWQASADGRPLSIVQASGIHMAMAVPAGAESIKVRYLRPLLREVFFR